MKEKKPKFVRTISMIAFRCLPLVAIAVLLSGASVVVDPYAGVDWETTGQHQANLHCHTTQSDGWLTPNQVVDEYRARGYTILALTDHNLCTWPWTGFSTMERKGRAGQGDRDAKRPAPSEDSAREGRRQRERAPQIPAYEDRDPEALGMLAVTGNEPSLHHHMGAYFIQYETLSNKIEQTLSEVAGTGGIAMLFHPGRYWEKDADGTIPDETVENYIRLFRENDHLFGVEVINQGMRYKHDIELWDKMLAVVMPDRPIWGYANDDMHAIGALGRDSSMFLLDALDEKQLREAMLKGRSYIRSVSTHEQSERDMAETPIIKAIAHDAAAGTIAITAFSGGKPLPEDRIRWISNGETVHTGATLDYKNTSGLGNYVRAEIRGNGGTAFTNPFGLAP
jgi:hypothetical protein